MYCDVTVLELQAAAKHLVECCVWSRRKTYESDMVECFRNESSSSSYWLSCPFQSRNGYFLVYEESASFRQWCPLIILTALSKNKSYSQFVIGIYFLCSILCSGHFAHGYVKADFYKWHWLD
ncbi:hypothetical protein CEXT_592831 [Caerostris extrusa]|uniref:Uncharacterized protein n=1 Tax=Caerostris extrusa TaxID=172846 RepID=A0AAV4UMI7_CAEEX|nr:hypothetical protein CEXT_592831 [Caerostris extrusa]